MLGGKAGFSCLGRCSAAEALVVEKVTNDVAALDPGLTIAGEKTHDMPAGRLVHESVTGLLKDPDFGATTIFEAAV
jgi:hypothetical protein